jgi:hypothetical protein
LAKMALIERELKRDKLVAKYAKKHAELKGIANDFKRSDEERECSPPGAAEAALATQTHASAQPLRHHGPPPWHVPALRSGARKDPRNGHGR